MCLVFDAQPERGAVPFGHRREHIAEPGRQGVGVDRHRQLDDAGRVERVAGLVPQEPRLPPQPHQPFAVRGRAARRAPADKNLARGGLQRADALADRARRDVQVPGGGLEASVIGDGHERVDLAGVQVHQHS
jgi:hypothetical protein